MGKSDKKVKSERINVLRKQYDAFLEDDKKRKERNEYILEKLDKMRYCTAMVQVRQKPPVFGDYRKISFYNTPEQALDSNTSLSNNDQQFIQLDTPRKRIDDTVLLQEISKKYILIPKLRPTYENDLARAKLLTQNVETKLDENADWKSKYEILEQLKKDEKETDNSTGQETFLISSPTPVGDPGAGNYFKENDVTKDDEPLLEYKNELPVKLPPEDCIDYGLTDYSINDTHVEQNYSYSNQIADSNYSTNEGIIENDDAQMILQNTVPNVGDIQNTICEKDGIQNIVYNQNNIDCTNYDHIPSKDNENENIYSNVEEIVQSMEPFDISNITAIEAPGEIYPQITTESLSHEQYIPKEEENNNVLDTKKHLVEADVSSEHDIDTSGHESNNVVPPENDSEILATNIEEYPIKSITAAELTPNEGIELVDGENINPKSQVLVESTDLTHYYDPVVETDAVVIPGDPSNIEQSEGFYNEQTENYDYTEEGVAQNYNTEYTAPTENYQQNEEYAYYEGGQTEHTAINENEEIQHQYDPNYEQQYGTAYDQQGYQQQEYQQEYAQGYDQQGYTAEPQQQYETVDQTQQELQYENQENFTPQYVEQQLDNEEGYVENPIEITQEVPVETPVESQQTSAVVADSEAKVQ